MRVWRRKSSFCIWCNVRCWKISKEENDKRKITGRIWQNILKEKKEKEECQKSYKKSEYLIQRDIIKKLKRNGQEDSEGEKVN